MKYSSSLYWFESVLSQSDRCFIDCLVDCEDRSSGKGYWLISSKGEFQVVFFQDAIAALEACCDRLIVGKVIRINIPIEVHA
ncbi:MAG: hypothetical protein U1E78_12030 [Gammaproteobacteria bacterium]